MELQVKAALAAVVRESRKREMQRRGIVFILFFFFFGVRRCVDRGMDGCLRPRFAGFMWALGWKWSNVD